jgi:3-phenylpropionate/trans-cinnamate dioxygenase ferredoxin component
MKHFVCKTSAFTDDKSFLSVELSDITVVVLKEQEGVYRCLEDRCSHADIPLSEGSVEKDESGRVICIECPAHGAKFDIKNGKPLCMPAVTSVKTFPVEVVDDSIFITV